MIKYLTGWGQIEKVDVLRETDKSVWVDGWNRHGVRKAKRGVNYNYWNTWQEAHSYLMQKKQEQIDSLRNQLAHEEKGLARIVEMKEK